MSQFHEIYQSVMINTFVIIEFSHGHYADILSNEGIAFGQV